MAVSLSIHDFRLFRAVCEVRYADAYLIWDHTGHVFHELRNSFTDPQVIGPSPNVSTFKSDEGAFGLELGQCRFTSDKPDGKLEVFGNQCKRFFDVVTDCLDIKVFTRIGLRLFFRKDFKDLKESIDVNSLHILNLEPGMRFGAAPEPQEFLVRWQGSQMGTTLRLKAESGTIDIILPPELEAPKSEIHKAINGLSLDVDYYTVAPVDKAQWDASAWIPQSLRTVKRETGAIIDR